MFKLLRYNCEGHPNLFTYEFFNNVYIIHGDFDNHFINGLYTDVESTQGGVYYNDVEIESSRNFARNEASVIFPSDNFIPYLTFKENLEFNRKVKREYQHYDYTIDFVFEVLSLDKSLINKRVIVDDYVMEKKLAIAKALLSNDNIILVCFNPKEELKNENIELLDTIIKINDKIKKIFIVSDIKRHYESGEGIFLKYFHGYISEKIMEEKWEKF